MHLVELLGIPGSGKSTISDRVGKLAEASGLKLWKVGSASQLGVARRGGDPLARGVARVVAPWSQAIWKQAMARSSDQLAVLADAVGRRPGLVSAIIQANQAHNVGNGSEVVLERMFNHVIRFERSEGVLGPGDWMLVAEGFCQRVVSLFAADFDAADHGAELETYLSLIPVPDVLGVLSVPIELAFERLEKKGWTTRIADTSRPRRLDFLDTCAQLVAIAARYMEAAGATVVPIDGAASLDTGANSITSAVWGRSAAEDDQQQHTGGSLDNGGA